jgi:hypothetical protein
MKNDIHHRRGLCECVFDSLKFITDMLLSSRLPFRALIFRKHAEDCKFCQHTLNCALSKYVLIGA